MRSIIFCLGCIGAFLFTTLLAASYVRPMFVETIALEIVRHEVEKRVGKKLEAIDGSKLTQLAERISRRNATEIETARNKLKAELPKKIAAVVAEMGNASCECRKFVEEAATAHFKSTISNLANINERLTSLIRTKYMEVAHSLTREFRIFTSANAIVFALLAITAVLRKSAKVHLILPAVILIGASIFVGALYIFKQDWLHAILFDDYVWLWYFGYLAIAIAFLADVLLNRGRISTRIVNISANILRSAVQISPC